jgi:hypothetical protein
LELVALVVLELVMGEEFPVVLVVLTEVVLVVHLVVLQHLVPAEVVVDGLVFILDQHITLLQAVALEAEVVEKVMEIMVLHQAVVYKLLVLMEQVLLVVLEHNTVVMVVDLVEAVVDVMVVLVQIVVQHQAVETMPMEQFHHLH